MKSECDTKYKLLAAATSLMWENSYGSVSVDDICAMAGVRKGSFYYFFPSKSDLTVAALEELWRQKQPVYDQIFSAQTPPFERLEKFCEMVHQGQKEKKDQFGKVCGCPFYTLGSEMSTQDERIRVKVAEMSARYRRYFETTLAEMTQHGGVPQFDPVRKAQELLAFMEGCLLQAKVNNSLEPIKNMASGILRLLGRELQSA